MAVNQAPRRITALANINKLNTEASEDLLNALQLPASSTAPTTEADRKHSPGKWYIAADYKQNTEAAKGDLWDDEGEADYGSVSIPFSRIAMRDSNGIIPESMLPSYIDEIMFGTLDRSSGPVTTFTVIELGGTEKVFASPTQTGSQLVPPSNAIFYDTSNPDHPFQYRWVEAAKDLWDGSDVFHGFTVIPTSKTISTNYGIEITRNDPNNTIIDAKKADFFTMYASAGPQEVGNSFTKFPFDSGTSKSENANLTVAASSDKVTVSNLIEGVRYMVNLQLSATPKTLSSNIIDVSFNCSTVPTQVQQMDMSGPSGAATKLNFVCTFRLNSGTTADLQIKAEEAINVTTTRFTIFELL